MLALRAQRGRRAPELAGVDALLEIRRLERSVLAEGLLGSADGVPKIACPLHKNQFALTTGECLDDPSLQIMTFDVRVIDGRVEAFLPPTSKLDSVLSTEDNYLRATETEGLISSKLDSILDAEMPGDFAVPPSTLAGVGNATAV